MANEFQVPYAYTGTTLYVVVRDLQNRAWNGAAFVVYDALDYATYAIPLTEQGAAEWWVGDFPIAIPNGVYSYVAYVRGGASPAESDAPTAYDPAFNWSGGAPKPLQPIAFQTRQEWRFWPNREAVTLRILGADLTYTNSAISDAKFRAINYKEMTASQGAYIGRDRVCLVPAEVLLPGVSIKSGDKIRQGDGTDWTVLEVQAGKFLQTFRCVTRCLALVYDLSANVVVKRPSPTTDASGKRNPTFATIYNVRAKLQEQSASVQPDYQGGPTGRRELTMYTDTRMVLLPGDVIDVGATRYDYAGSANWDRIDGLGEVKLYQIEG